LGLLWLAQHHGYTPAGGYIDGCHLCYEARRFLHLYYPDHLAPVHPYIESEGV
jgi:hypothetical protein